ncbi:hypothetical protein FQN60_001026 [Etheostoma spectabile]|uniref:Uncharacterized protein n=1 Tax=Etheostoma spectabile TaxID=54343 RepID=A0A5J5D2T3_9PERO|nr:hypothetical protein FQN60_001026 [Etheostoma spectabile]
MSKQSEPVELLHLISEAAEEEVFFRDLCAVQLLSNPASTDAVVVIRRLCAKAHLKEQTQCCHHCGVSGTKEDSNGFRNRSREFSQDLNHIPSAYVLSIMLDVDKLNPSLGIPKNAVESRFSQAMDKVQNKYADLKRGHPSSSGSVTGKDSTWPRWLHLAPLGPPASSLAGDVEGADCCHRERAVL